MQLFKKFIDFLTLGSDRPIRRLVAYYIALSVLVFLLFHFIPYLSAVFSGEHIAPSTDPSVLRDMLESSPVKRGPAEEIAATSRLDLTVRTVLTMISTLLLMLPVSWVYMSARRTRDANQHVSQTLILLPLVVAGMVMIVKSNLALAFSLGGIVAALRLRTTMRDVRDPVYMLLGIGVGLAAGVQALTVASTLSIIFNFVVLLAWRYEFGRNVLEPTASSQWTEPLGDLADNKVGAGPVPDRDLMLALSPKDAATLAKRFKRVHKMLGTPAKKPRFNAVLSVTTDNLTEAQIRVESVLNSLARRWRLDEVVTNTGKPCEIYYMVGIRRNVTRDQMLTAIREAGSDKVFQVTLEMAESAIEKEEK
jgi:hypothetical protein